MHHILDEDGNVCEEQNIFVWARWLEKADRIVAKDTVGESRISTVFLSLDHNFAGEGPPILWETLVFDGPMDGEMDRYSSREDAEAGHKAMVERVREGGAT